MHCAVRSSSRRIPNLSTIITFLLGATALAGADELVVAAEDWDASVIFSVGDTVGSATPVGAIVDLEVLADDASSIDVLAEHQLEADEGRSYDLGTLALADSRANSRERPQSAERRADFEGASSCSNPTLPSGSISRHSEPLALRDARGMRVPDGMKPVLYVEDSIASQALMRRFLKGVCSFTMAADPATALRLLEQRPFALVICDFLFPEGDALDLIRLIRQKSSPTELPLIVVSSSMDAFLRNRVIRAGANETVSKPINMGKLRTTVATMLDAPYVSRLRETFAEVACLQWREGAEFFQYCPALHFLVRERSAEAAAQAMEARLEKHQADGSDFSEISEVSLGHHRIRQ